MIDATRSTSPERELAARGRDASDKLKAVARPNASGPLSRREAHARAEAGPRPQPGRERPRRAPTPPPPRRAGGGSGPDAPHRASGRARSWHQSSRRPIPAAGQASSPARSAFVGLYPPSGPCRSRERDSRHVPTGPAIPRSRDGCHSIWGRFAPPQGLPSGYCGARGWRETEGMAGEKRSTVGTLTWASSLGALVFIAGAVGGSLRDQPDRVVGALLLLAVCAAACGFALHWRLRKAQLRALRDPLTVV